MLFLPVRPFHSASARLETATGVRDPALIPSSTSPLSTPLYIHTWDIETPRRTSRIYPRRTAAWLLSPVLDTLVTTRSTASPSHSCFDCFVFVCRLPRASLRIAADLPASRQPTFFVFVCDFRQRCLRPHRYCIQFYLISFPIDSRSHLDPEYPPLPASRLTSAFRRLISSRRSDPGLLSRFFATLSTPATYLSLFSLF